MLFSGVTQMQCKVFFALLVLNALSNTKNVCVQNRVWKCVWFWGQNVAGKLLRSSLIISVCYYGAEFLWQPLKMMCSEWGIWDVLLITARSSLALLSVVAVKGNTWSVPIKLHSICSFDAGSPGAVDMPEEIWLPLQKHLESAAPCRGKT